MGLFSSIFSRSETAADAAAETESGDSVARARSRARQRLLGAVVLVGIGIIGFPLLFETQPRPIPVDVPIEIPARDSVAPLKLPGATGGQAAATAGTAEKAPVAKPEPIITETAAEAGSTIAPGKPAGSTDQAPAATADRAADKSTDKVAEKAADKAADNAPEKPADKPVGEAPESKSAESADAARARALLEGKVAPKDAAATARYIVQIGAFADPVLARATRLKVERLGLTTYTHVAKTPDGERTRVRVGPVTSRAEAEQIASKIKAAGLPTAILTL